VYERKQNGGIWASLITVSEKFSSPEQKQQQQQQQQQQQKEF
jgi:hypothetical protein